MAHLTDEQLGSAHKLYEQVCTSYRGIDDFRARLLGLLPLASAGGIFLLLDKVPAKGGAPILLTVGSFGFLVTLGLFAYELFGITKCDTLIRVGQELEEGLGVRGQFVVRPHAVGDVIDEPFAAGIIYPAVLGAWLYLALFRAWPVVAAIAAAAVIVLGFAGCFAFDYRLRHHPTPLAAPSSNQGRAPHVSPQSTARDV